MDLRPWTLPNLLTFLRLVALPFLVMTILDGRHGLALVIFLVAAITDIVDGYLARHFGMGSPLGAYLDPIADKLFLVSTFVVFALRATPTAVRIPAWLLVLTIFRDVLILVVALVMYLSLGTREFPPSVLGKLTTFSEICTIVAILLANIGALPPLVAHAFFGIVAGLTMVSGLHYILRASRGIARHKEQAAQRPAP
jgi:cardiolipin synthase (CMP-forming)